MTGPKTCANCGDTIDEHEWYPIRSGEDDDGEFRLYSFCGEACAEAWESDESKPDQDRPSAKPNHLRE